MSDAVRIGVAGPGDPRDPAGFSGAPHALMGGLDAAGVTPVALPGRFPPRVDRELVRATALLRVRPRTLADLRDLQRAAGAQLPAAGLSTPVSRAREARIAVSVRRNRPLDGIVLCGTTAGLHGREPYVTYEDTTIAQARRAYRWPWLEGTTPADHARHDARAAKIYAGARACCAMSHWAARSIVDDYGIDPARVHVVGVGAIRRTVPPSDRDWSLPRFLFVGFDWERKNGPRILRAFRRLRTDIPEATLDVVGGHPPLDEPGVTGHGSIALDDAGGDARLRALYARATCFVMPSIHEPSAQAYIEAGSAGIPAIGTTNGGSATVIGDGGVAVDPEDEDAILEAMRTLGAGPHAAAVGELAAAHAARLTWPLVAERLVRALRPGSHDTDGMASFL